MTLSDQISELLGGAKSGTTFGFDYGTTNCVFAYKEGVTAPPKMLTLPQAIRNGAPSLFMRGDDGREYACDEVLQQNGLENNPGAVCASIKTKLREKVIRLNGHDYEPKYIAAAVAKRFMQICELALEDEMVYDEIKIIVCGVPVRFDAETRGELKAVLQEATGKTVYLVPEPILAALTKEYYEKKGAERKGERFVPKDTLAIDVGGGTTDLVLLKPNATPTDANPFPFTAHSPDGFEEAGDDMDKRMFALMLEKITENPGTIGRSKLKLFSNEQDPLHRRLLHFAKLFKEQLSANDYYESNLAFSEYGSVNVRITRAEYEDRVRPLIQKIVDHAADILEKSYSAKQPDVDIMLVGGATYTPLLTAMLRKRFPWLKDRIHQRFPEMAVAMGAAIYAEDPALVNPKVAFGYAVDTFTADKKKEVLQVVIPSDAVLPKTDISRYQTLQEGQLAVTFHVYEIYNTDGRTELSMDEGCQKEYAITHKFGRRVPMGTEVKLTTTLTEEGLLTMKISDFLYDSPGPTTKTFTLSGTTPA